MHIFRFFLAALVLGACSNSPLQEPATAKEATRLAARSTAVAANDISLAARVAGRSTLIAAADIAQATGMAARSSAEGIGAGVAALRKGAEIAHLPRMQHGTVLAGGGASPARVRPRDPDQREDWHVRLPSGVHTISQAGLDLTLGQEVIVVREDFRLLIIP